MAQISPPASASGGNPVSTAATFDKRRPESTGQDHFSGEAAAFSML
jgi:hypothetical protein